MTACSYYMEVIQDNTEALQTDKLYKYKQEST